MSSTNSSAMQSTKVKLGQLFTYKPSHLTWIQFGFNLYVVSNPDSNACMFTWTWISFQSELNVKV